MKPTPDKQKPSSNKGEAKSQRGTKKNLAFSSPLHFLVLHGRRGGVRLCVFACAFVLCSSLPALSQKNAKFTDPILSGCYPDPSICHVGSDYYLVTSSFSYFPGIPIFLSKDLANWKQIGHVKEIGSLVTETYFAA